MGEVPESVAIVDLVSEVRRQVCSSVAGGSTAELRIDVEETVPTRIDLPIRGLVQSLRSLLQNAWDAGASGQEVRLSVRRAQARVVFEVEDGGIGMDAVTLERVGEPFFTTKPPGRGMGLGLFLARTFAERWHGQLTLRSSAGQGTCAALELPLTPEGRADVP